MKEMEFKSFEDEEEVETRGMPSSPFLASVHDLNLSAESHFQNIPVSGKESASPFHKDTENLHGDVEKDMERAAKTPKFVLCSKNSSRFFVHCHLPLPVANWWCVILN